jgi:hypothetical protein
MSTQAPEAPVTEPAPQPAETAPPQPQAPEPAAAPPAPAAAPAPAPQAQPQAAAPPAPAPAPPPPARQGPPAALHLQPRPPDDAPETERLAWEVAHWKHRARQHEDRVKGKNQQLSEQERVLRRIAEQVGVEFDEQPDPQALAERLEAANATARAKSVELAVYTTALQAGANAPALLDSRAFMDQAAVLDPDSPDFTAQVGDLVREAAQQERYQMPKPPPPPAAEPAVQQVPPQPPPAQPPAAANGADFSGAPGGNRKWTPADYDRYMATADLPGPDGDRDRKKLEKAIADGLLSDLGIGTKRRSYR